MGPSRSLCLMPCQMHALSAMIQLRVVCVTTLVRPALIHLGALLVAWGLTACIPCFSLVPLSEMGGG